MNDKDLMKRFRDAGGLPAIAAVVTVSGQTRLEIQRWQGGAVLMASTRAVIVDALDRLQR